MRKMCVQESHRFLWFHRSIWWQGDYWHLYMKINELAPLKTSIVVAIVTPQTDSAGNRLWDFGISLVHS